MNKKIKQQLNIWEDMQMQTLEKRVEKQPEHTFSKEFEDRISMLYQQRNKKKTRKKPIIITAITAVTILLIVICRFSDISGLAADWLEEFLHLQIHVIQEDETGKKTKEAYSWENLSVTVEKKQETSDEITVEFDTLMDMTEREYWNYLKENELSPKRGPSYIPEGYTLDNDIRNTWYSYTYEEKAEDEFNDTKTLMEVFPGTGFCRTDKKKPLKAGKDTIKVGGRDVKLVLRNIRKTWKKGKNEFSYYEEIHNWTKRYSFHHVKSCEKVFIGKKEGYVIKTKDRIYIDFYQETSRISFCGIGKNQKWIYKELVKMVESLQ